MAIFEGLFNHSFILSLRYLKMSSSTFFLLLLLICSYYYTINGSKRDIEVGGNVCQGHAYFMQTIHPPYCLFTEMLRRTRFFQITVKNRSHYFSEDKKR